MQIYLFVFGGNDVNIYGYMKNIKYFDIVRFFFVLLCFFIIIRVFMFKVVFKDFGEVRDIRRQFRVEFKDIESGVELFKFKFYFF